MVTGAGQRKPGEEISSMAMALRLMPMEIVMLPDILLLMALPSVLLL